MKWVLTEAVLPPLGGPVDGADYCDILGPSVTRQFSYPFPRWAGKFLIYNQFETVAVRA